MDIIQSATEKREEIPIEEEISVKEEKMTLLNIDNMKTFSQKIKLLDIKNSFKKTLYEKRMRYGRLTNLGIVNQNLRLNKHFNFEEIKYLNNKSLYQTQNTNEIKNSKDNSTDIPFLKINLKGNFRDEIEKILYDPKFDLNIRPDSRELKLLQLLKQKIERLNSLD